VHLDEACRHSPVIRDCRFRFRAHAIAHVADDGVTQGVGFCGDGRDPRDCRTEDGGVGVALDEL